ncbi:MAG: YicC/YloC family endoribonuclease [Pseudomonadota bacterium]
MTGFASVQGGVNGVKWSWEARSVNGRGLDLRLRLPDGLERLETTLRAVFGKAFSRGSITLTLKLKRVEQSALPRLSLPHLDAVLDVAEELTNAAAQRGLAISPPCVGDLMAFRGVVDHDAPAAEDDVAVMEALVAEVEPLANALLRARIAEGSRLSEILAEQLVKIDKLLVAAEETAAIRDTLRGEVLRQRVASLLEATPVVDETRLAQELAMIAVKADVTEELDRLKAHLAAAHDLIAEPGPIGRKFDFLSQEFNREANTLCSKSASSDLTAVGLEMKVAIDQMREQIQNVE